MSDIRFTCPSCGQHLSVDSSMRGELVACPSCEEQITVPAPAPVRKRRLILRTADVPQSPGTSRPRKQKFRSGRSVTLLLVGLAVGYIAGATGIPAGSLKDAIGRRVGGGIISGRLTKEQWKARVYEHFASVEGRQGYMPVPTALWFIDGDEFVQIMGKPDRTQTIGGKVYWYYPCRDGMIQLVLQDRLGMDNLLIGDINDY